MKKRDKFIIGSILVVLFAGVLFPATSAVLNWKQYLNDWIDVSNGRLRVKFEDYDSTTSGRILETDDIAYTVHDATTHALVLAPIGDLAFTGDLTVTGDTSLDGALTVNDSSADKDVRIESNGSANAIFVDGGNDRVGIFNGTPAVPLDVTGEVQFDGGDFNINEDSGDYDFKYETDSTDKALFIDSGNSTLETNGVTITINQGGADVNFTIESDDVATALVVDAGDDRLDWGTWYTTKGASAIQATSYSVAATDRASYYDVDYTDTGIVGITLDTDLVSMTGLILTFCDTELNANNNNIQIGTEGSETINEGNTYTMNAAGECVTLRTNGTNWHVIGGYLE
jgi:hypothetical protein